MDKDFEKKFKKLLESYGNEKNIDSKPYDIMISILKNDFKKESDKVSTVKHIHVGGDK